LGLIPELEFKPKLFADDANIFVFAENFVQLQIKCQDTLNLLSTWLLANRLTINISKTCYMIFLPHTNISIPTNFELLINNTALIRVVTTKFLGVIIDSKLTWKNHINALCTHLRRFIGIFYKISLFLPINILKILY